MPNVIIIRLHPDKPVSGTDFTNYLNGLTITAYDISYAHAKRDPATTTQIGQAQYLPGGDPNFSDITKNQIQQHASLQVGFPPTATLVDVNSGNPESVAAAMIEVKEPAGYPEYVGPDLLLQISRGGTTITGATTLELYPPRPRQSLLLSATRRILHFIFPCHHRQATYSLPCHRMAARRILSR